MHRLFASAVLTLNSVKHFFLFCPRYTAQRNVLFTSATILFSVKRGHQAAMLGKLIFLLYGVKSVNYGIN